MCRSVPSCSRRNTSRRLLATVIVGGLLAVPGSGQERERPREPQARFGEVVEVHVLELDVLVETFGGKPLLDLRKEDFEVYEDGERREIVAFERPRAVAEASAGGSREEAPGAGRRTPRVPAARRPAHDFVLAFDAESVDRLRLARALPDIEAFVRRHAGESRRWTVVILGSQPYAIIDWTTDPEQVAEGLQRTLSALKGRATPSWGVTSFLVQADVEAWEERTAALLAEEGSGGGVDAQDALDSRGDQRSDQRREFLERIAQCSRWSGVGVLATALSTRALLRSLVARPGSRTFALFYTDQRIPALPYMTADCIAAATRVKRSWQDAARAAQSHRFQVYGVDLAGLSGLRAREDGVEVESADNSLDAIAAFQIPDGLKMASVLTGGRDVHANDWTEGLQRAVDDARSRYSLAVRVPHPHDGEEHTIEVRIEGHRGAYLRYPRRYTDLSRRQLLETQLAGSGNVPRAGGSFPLSFEVETETASQGRPAAVSARVTAPLARLGLVPRPDGSLEATTESWLAVYLTSTGERTALHRIPRTIQVPAAESAGAESATFSQVFELALPPGDWTLVGAIYSPTDDTAAVATERIRVARD